MPRFLVTFREGHWYTVEVEADTYEAAKEQASCAPDPTPIYQDYYDFDITEIVMLAEE